MTNSAERYEIAPVTLQYGATPDNLHLAQMQGFRMNSNAQKSRMRAGGSVDSLAHILGRGKPSVSLNTRDLATVFSQISPTIGMTVTGDAIFRVHERDQTDVWTGAGVKYTAAGGGFVYPTSLSAGIDDADGASVGLMFIPFWDGTNLPLAAAAIQDTSGDPTVAFTSQFFLGPVYHNSVEIRGIQHTSVNFGLTVSAAPLSPGPFDNSAAITDRNPMIQFRTSKANEVSNLFYGSITNNMSFYFQRGAASADRIAKGTASHVKVSCTAADVEVEEVGGDAPGDVDNQFTIRPVGPISISIASAIP